MSGEERRQRLLRVGSAAVFLTIVVVAVLIVVSQTDTEGGDTKLEDAALVKRELQGIPQNGLVLGEPKAAITLVEFGDLQCPVCKGYAEEILPQVIESKVRSGEARLEFRNYTIINDESLDAAGAAIAAGEQGRGWDFIELFYRNQGIEASGYVTDEFLTAVAEEAGVTDIPKWNAARVSNRVTDQVGAETAEAEQLGLTGTPSFVLEGPGTDGKEVIGTPGSAGALEEAIEDAG